MPLPVIQPGKSGSARVEYCACREEVEAMLAKGYSVRMVYEHFQEQGRITCSYSAFCDYVRGQGKRKHSKGVKKPTSRKAVDQKKEMYVLRQESPKVTKPEDIDYNSLF
jgi:hypothetical protein